jgi:alpha-ketoglutarate-dependent taurine dioxygenase
MIIIEPIEFPGVDTVLNNIGMYKEKFLADSVVLFRNANLDYDTQAFFHSELTKRLNCHTKLDENKKTSKYIEDHSKNPRLISSEKNDVMLRWHVEHVTYKNPIVMSTWNMTKFTTDTENGKTYFVDCEKVYSEMPDDWKNFLSNCKANHPGKNSWNSDEEFPLVYDHWITGNPVLRTVIREFSEDNCQLVSVNNKKPTEDDIKLFKKISSWVGKYIYNNENARIVQKWQQGDLLMVDIFKMAHAVTGGFDPKDREFIGMWGYRDLD